MKFIYLLLITSLLGTHCKAQETEAPNAEGVWKIVLKQDRKLIQALRIYKEGKTWKAQLGDKTLAVKTQQGKFIIDDQKTKARFDGAFTSDQQYIKGFWRQYQYAAPVKLAKTAQGWKGTREVQFQQLTMYLILKTDQRTGQLKGHIYNHERNQGVYVRIRKIVQTGRKIAIYVRNREEPILTGKIAADGNTLKMPINIHWMKGDTFRKVDPNKEIRMQPRIGQTTYTYTQPEQVKDGWKTASLKKLGADMSKVKEMTEAILTKKYPALHSVLITHKGKLVMEEYFYGYDRDQLHDTRSAGKSLASTMIGLAMDRNLLTSVDQKVVDLFPQYKGQIQNLDERKKRLRIRDLMTMSTGLACNDDTYKSPGNEDRMQNQDKQPDWVKYTLDLPMKREPGTKAIYCSGGVNVLGQIVSNVSGKQTYEFLHEYLFEPLGIERYTMNLTPVNNGYLGGGIHMRPRDLAKFGQLFLNKGTWNGKQVLSKKWVIETATGHSTINDVKYKNYGYNWWIQHYEVGGKKYKAFYAMGNGGQLIFVVPKLDMVVAFNAGNYGRFSIWGKYIKEIMPQYIIPAMMKAKK